MAFADWQNLNTNGKRKARTGAVLGAPMSATPPTAMTTGATPALVTKPTGYFGFGLTTDDGAVVSRSVDTTDITAWQSQGPIRTDVTSDTESIAVTFHESNAYVISTYYGVDITTLVPNATTGEVSWAKPDLPAQAYMRFLVLSRDIADSSEILIMESFPRVTVSDWDDLSYSKSDEGIVFGMTFTALLDSTVGYTKKTFYGGVGFKAASAALGFPAAV